MSRKPPPPPGSERRRHQRFELVAQIQVHADDEVRLLDVGNISASGVLIELSHTEVARVAVGDRLRVVLDLGADDLRFEADGRVVRVLPISARKPGFAIEWLPLDDAQAAALGRILGTGSGMSGS